MLARKLNRIGITFHGGYVDALGNKGTGLNNLVVFNQEICGICNKNKVTKVTLSGRGTYYCSKCQQ